MQVKVSSKMKAVMKIGRVPDTRKIPAARLRLFCVQVTSYPLRFLSLGPALAHPRPLFDLDTGPCSSLGRASL